MNRSHVFVALAVLAWGAAPLFDKTALKKDTDVWVALTFRAGMIFVMLAALLAGTGRLQGLWHMGSSTQAVLVFGGLFSGVVGMGCYFVAMREMDPSLVVGLTSTYPAVTLMLGWAVFGERLAIRQWSAIGLIVLGVVLLQWPAGGNPAEQPEQDPASSTSP
jgi:uncharacterized membrane protein